jgi:hypothetical protein
VPVVVISESTAHRLWPNEDALGKHMGVGVANQQAADSTASFPEYEVVGLTNDTRQGVIFRPVETWLYLPMSATQANTSSAGQFLIVSTTGDARAVMTVAQREADALDPGLLVVLRLVDDALATQAIPFQDVALLAGALGMLALALASIGLYSVMSFIIGLRTREIGIRMALGAQSPQRDHSLFGARRPADCDRRRARAGRRHRHFQLAGSRTDGHQPIRSAGLWGGRVFHELRDAAACWIPVRRATRIDPMVALRCE